MSTISNAPTILKDFLSYHETVKAHSAKTVDEYFLDLRTFFRYLKRSRGLVSPDTPWDSISIADVDLELVGSVSLSEIYDYLIFLSRERQLSTASLARKIAAIRSFYRYLTSKAHLLEENPVQELDSPRMKKTLPRYLTLEESLALLDAVQGKNKERDYCILMLFLNCGLRISELVNLNVSDIQDDTIRVLGKGNKERILYLNDGCKAALESYLTVRAMLSLQHEPALFVSNRRTRITRAGVHKMVKKYLLTAGLDELRGREAAIEKEIARQCRLLRTVRAWRTEAEAACALMGRFELEANTATRFLPYHGFIFHHQVIHNLLISIFVIT